MAPTNQSRAGTRVRSTSSLPADFPQKPTGWPYKDPFDFMIGKRVDDKVPMGLHRVHDKLYDLSRFHHPGGALWLDLTVGTDITELFETHHLNYQKAVKMLDVYEIKGHKKLEPRRSLCTFAAAGFYATLRDKVWREYAALSQIGPSKTSIVSADLLVLFSLSLTISVGQYMMVDMTYALFLAIFLGAVNGLFIGVGHNFMHQRCSFRRFYLDISGFSSAEFRMHHALSHHPFTNTTLDAEINSLLPEVSFFPGHKTRAQKWTAGVTLAIICTFGILIRMMQRFSRILLGTWPASIEDKIAQLIPLLQLVLLSNGSLQNVLHGLVLWITMLMTTSSVFMWGNFLTGPHFNDECWHQGDTLDSTDWGILQIQTSVERADLSSADWLLPNLANIATFNHHHLHHLFPTIDAFYLTKLLPLFDAHCIEHHVVFNKMSNGSLARGLWRCIISSYEEPNNRTRNGIVSDHTPAGHQFSQKESKQGASDREHIMQWDKDKMS